MAFYVVEVDNDGFKIYDSAGTLIDPAKDSSAQSILTALNAIKDTDGIKKITDALPAGTNVIGKVDQGTAGASLWKVDGSGVTQPISAAALPLPAGAAEEATLLLIKAKTDNIPADPAREGGNLATLAAVDFATQTTLSSIDAAAATIDAVLDSIKDTDGIKKITDQLPAGTNEIGKVAQGTKALASEAWPLYVVDGSGNVVGVVLDGAVYRLRTEAKIVRASDGAQINPATQETLALIKDTDGVKKIVDPLPAGTNHLGSFRLRDATADYWAQVLSDGRLSTASLAPPPPTGGTAIKRLVDGDVASNQTLEDIYTIPSGNTVVVQRFQGGGENTVAGGRIELVYREGTTDTLLAVGYIAGGNFQFDLEDSFAGDGSTKHVVIRRINLGGVKMRQSACWQGYYIGTV